MTAESLPGGGTVPIPERSHGAPHRILERHFRGILAVERVSEREFEARGWTDGSYAVSVVVGSREIARRTVVLMSGGPPETVEIRIPAGRILGLDWTEARRWSESPDGGTFLATYCAWPAAPAPHLAADGSFRDSPTVAGAIEMPWNDIVATEGSFLFVPEGVEAVAFGFLEPARGGGLTPVHLVDSVHMGSVPETGVLSVPVPRSACAASSRLRVSLRHKDRPFRVEGIPVSVSRVPEEGGIPGAPIGSREALSGSDGVAVLLLFPGRYGFHLSSEVRSVDTDVRNWPQVQTRGGGDMHEAMVDVKFGR
jgi:hypothetical protein